MEWHTLQSVVADKGHQRGSSCDIGSYWPSSWQRGARQAHRESIFLEHAGA